MNTIKKIILASVASIFVATSAFSGALEVTGTMEITSTQKSAQETGNPLGMENEWALTASTELDNGVGVAYKQSVGQGMAANDSKLMFTLVGLGTIGFDSTGTPMDAIDDKTPSAFEEATHGTGTLNDIGQNDGTMGIRYTLADVMGSGITVDSMYFPKAGSGDQTGDGGVSGDTGGNSGNSYEIVASGNPLATAGIDGVTIRVGTAQTENMRSAGEHDLTEYAAGIDYAYGPVTIGYQKNHRDLGGITTGGAETDTTNTHYSIAYAVNDSLSVSYGEAKSVERYAGDTSVEQEWDGISAGYSMGGMTVSFITGEAKNADYTVDRKEEIKQINLAVAF
jgi:outer membrane protein OmpU